MVLVSRADCLIPHPTRNRRQGSHEHAKDRLLGRDPGSDDTLRGRSRRRTSTPSPARGRNSWGSACPPWSTADPLGDWPLLTDEQRMEGVEALVRAGVKVIVGTGRRTRCGPRRLRRDARKVGAAGLMIISAGPHRAGPPPRRSMRISRASSRTGTGCRRSSTTAPTTASKPKADLFFALHEAYPHLIGFKEFAHRPPCPYAASTSRPLAGAQPHGRRRYGRVPRLHLLRREGSDHRHRQRPPPRGAAPCRLVRAGAAGDRPRDARLSNWRGR